MDAFLTRFDADGSLGYSSYYSGEMTDIGYAITLDAAGNVLLGGGSISPSVPVTPSAAQGCRVGGATAMSRGLI